MTSFPACDLWCVGIPSSLSADRIEHKLQGKRPPSVVCLSSIIISFHLIVYVTYYIMKCVWVCCCLCLFGNRTERSGSGENTVSTRSLKREKGRVRNWEKSGKGAPYLGSGFLTTPYMFLLMLLSMWRIELCSKNLTQLASIGANDKRKGEAWSVPL